MGYACPVCETPQRDAEHLANHLAFAAMLHDDGHRAWLDDNAPGWADEGPADLGERVAPLAPEATYEEVFEDTVHEGEAGRPVADRSGTAPVAERSGGDAMDETARAVLAEARELTRRMRSDGTGEGNRPDGRAGTEEEDETGGESAPDGTDADADGDGGRADDEET